jgi:hypothetical protein
MRRPSLGLALVALASARAAALAPRTAPPRAVPTASRRSALFTGLGSLACLAGAAPARAFDNAVPEYAEYKDKPKRPGTAPKDLGVAKRVVKGEDPLDDIEFSGLRGCDGKTNCFSTTGDFNLEDRILTGVDTLIAPWKPPTEDKAPFKSLVQSIKAYQPGQGFVDGGGFKVVKETDSYIYVQYEALKKGYIDDAEWFMGKDGLVTLRSASRVGSTDFGVNGAWRRRSAARVVLAIARPSRSPRSPMTAIALSSRSQAVELHCRGPSQQGMEHR